MSRTALITGASGGIGLEFARVFAQEGWDLVLVSRSKTDLQAIADQLERDHRISVHVIDADLTKHDAPGRIADALQKEDIVIDALINNAGYGSHGNFAELDVQRETGMIDLNVRAVTELTGLFLPGMLERKHGYVLNVASTAAFQPGPTMATYFATKAFVLSFSQSLWMETRGTGVTVTAVCPGPTKTGFEEHADEKGLPLFSGRLLRADRVARDAYAALMRGERVRVIGLRNRVQTWLAKILPTSLVLRVTKSLMS